MEFTGLQIAALVVCLAATVVGVALFARTVGLLLRTVRLGQPAERSNDPGLRTRMLLREFLERDFGNLNFAA